MSELTSVDTEPTLKDRVEYLEQIVKQLLEGQKATLEKLREMVIAVAEISEEE